jgi:hypothetical protein
VGSFLTQRYIEVSQRFAEVFFNAKVRKGVRKGSQRG